MKKENVENKKRNVLYALKMSKRISSEVSSTVAISDDIQLLIKYYNVSRQDWDHHSGTRMYFKEGSLLRDCLPLDDDELKNLFNSDSGNGISAIVFSTEEDKNRFLTEKHDKSGLIINKNSYLLNEK